MSTTTRGKHRQSIWQSFAPIGTALLALALLIVLTACGAATSESAPVTTAPEPSVEPVPVETAEPAPEPTAEPEPAPEPEPEPEPEFTLAQEQAIGSAEDYLSFSAFSKSGLIDQLVFEGFSESDAEFAVEHIDVDWNEQAVQSAKDYLDMTNFSRSGLIDQLEFEGFSTEQATYAADQLGL